MGQLVEFTANVLRRNIGFGTRVGRSREMVADAMRPREFYGATDSEILRDLESRLASMRQSV